MDIGACSGNLFLCQVSTLQFLDYEGGGLGNPKGGCLPTSMGRFHLFNSWCGCTDAPGAVSVWLLVVILENADKNVWAALPLLGEWQGVK